MDKGFGDLWINDRKIQDMKLHKSLWFFINKCVKLKIMLIFSLHVLDSSGAYW
jgi:hypothetical protein